MDSAIPLFAIGLVGSLVMFAGDMLLYFTPGAYDMDGTLRPYARIMRDLPEGRVRAGGVLGPVAAFLYVVGFAGLPLLAEGDLAWLARLTAGLLSFALICGGGVWRRSRRGSSYVQHLLKHVLKLHEILRFLKIVPTLPTLFENRRNCVAFCNFQTSHTHSHTFPTPPQ